MDRKRKRHDYFRFVVSHGSNDFIYGYIVNDRKRLMKICVADTSSDSGNDFSYLKNITTSGTSLNLIDAEIADDVIRPQYIILSPDYLIDISSIAACFEDYGNSPKLYLLNRLKQHTSNENILLGNFASQMLDEELFLSPEENSYRRSAEHFFHNNIISLLSSPLKTSFHGEAKWQKANIHRLLNENLPELAPMFDKSKVMVEPSFFSEMLGLQGRMDFLQIDSSLLIEQKSGRARLQKHRVQMQLYMFLLECCQSDLELQSSCPTKAFLLYSKQIDGLVAQEPDHHLLREAFRIRNEIVAEELELTTKDAIHLLSLTADELNTSGDDSFFWQKYQRPQIEGLLMPIRNASPLEQAYYFRFLRFIALEHRIAKIGGGRKTRNSFADNWRQSLQDKIANGCIYYDMSMTYPLPSQAESFCHVELSFPDNCHEQAADFRIGDAVILHAYRKPQEPDIRNKIVFRATIANIDRKGISLLLRSELHNSQLILSASSDLWAIEHDLIDAASTDHFRSIHTFLSAPKERRDLLLLQRRPHISSNKTLTKDYGELSSMVCGTKRADDFFIIIGPPGTGKTSFGMLLTLQEELQDADARVLLMAFTNRAVDEICAKLAEQDIDFIRLGNRSSTEEANFKHLLSERTANCNDLESARSMLASTRVFVGTTSSVSASQLLNLFQFSLAIIDEASQILEPQIIGILSSTYQGMPSIRRFVLIGDHKQLPAVVQQTRDSSKVSNSLLQSIMLYDCRESLFERLLRRYHDDKDVVYMMTKQGRMHREIATFPSKMFYNDLLTEASEWQKTVDNITTSRNNDRYEDAVTNQRLSFFDSETTAVGQEAETRQRQNKSNKLNFKEAGIAALLAYHVYKNNIDTFDSLRTVGIVVPYRNQISAIREYLRKHNVEALTNITIDTVERFQGSQRDTIIYSTTVTSQEGLDFLTENRLEENGIVVDRKLNVVLTRARKHFVIVGNATLLKQDSIYSSLIDHITRSKSLR